MADATVEKPTAAHEQEWIDAVIARLRTEQSLFLEDEARPHSRRLLVQRLLRRAFSLRHGNTLGNGSHTLVLGPRGVGKSEVLEAVVRELRRVTRDTPLVVHHCDLKPDQVSPVDAILKALGAAADTQFHEADLTTATDRVAALLRLLDESGKRVFLVIDDAHRYWELASSWTLPSAYQALGELYCLTAAKRSVVNVTIAGGVAVLRDLAFRRVHEEDVDQQYQQVFNAFTCSLNSTRLVPVTLLAPREPYPFARLLCAAVAWWPRLQRHLDAFAAEHDMAPLTLTSGELEAMEDDDEVVPPIVTMSFLASGGNLRLLQEFGDGEADVTAWLSATATLGSSRAVYEAIGDVQAANHAGATGSGPVPRRWGSWECMELVAASAVLDKCGVRVRELYQLSDEGRLTMTVNADKGLLVGFARPWEAMALHAEPGSESQEFGFRDMLAMLIPTGGIDEWWVAKSLAAAPSETTGLPASILEWDSRELQRMKVVSRVAFSRLSAFAAKTGVDMKPAPLKAQFNKLAATKRTCVEVAKAVKGWLTDGDITRVPRQVHKTLARHITVWSDAVSDTKQALFDAEGRPRWLKESPDVWGGSLGLVECGERKDDGAAEAIYHRVRVMLGGSKVGGAESKARQNSVAVVKKDLAAGDNCVATMVALALDVPVDRVKTKHYLVTTRERPGVDASTTDGLTVWGRTEMAPLWHEGVRKWANRVGDERYMSDEYFI